MKANNMCRQLVNPEVIPILLSAIICVGCAGTKETAAKTAAPARAAPAPAVAATPAPAEAGPFDKPGFVSQIDKKDGSEELTEQSDA